MKKTIYLLASLLTLTGTTIYANEYQPGPYLGGQFGWGCADEGNGYKKLLDNQTPTTKEIKQGKFFGWRAYIGYNFNHFSSIESGYSRYPDNTYKSSISDIKVQTYTIDLVGKLILPLGSMTPSLSKFSIYGKAGGAYVNATVNDDGVKNSAQTIRPAYGAGLVFNFTDNIAVDASWTGIYGKNRVGLADAENNSNNKPIPTCNLYTLGISYKITGIF